MLLLLAYKSFEQHGYIQSQSPICSEISSSHTSSPLRILWYISGTCFFSRYVAVVRVRAGKLLGGKLLEALIYSRDTCFFRSQMLKCKMQRRKLNNRLLNN